MKLFPFPISVAVSAAMSWCMSKPRHLATWMDERLGALLALLLLSHRYWNLHGGAHVRLQLLELPHLGSGRKQRS